MSNNTGDNSTGDYSTGNKSTGDNSTGYRSTGYRSTGDNSTGNYSTGDYSTGNYSTGDFSISNYSSGHLSTEDSSGFGCFDKPITIEEWRNAKRPNYFYFKLTISCGGQLEVLDYKEAWRKSWDKASREDRELTLRLPNWNNEKFRLISGIDVEKELFEKDEVKIEVEGKRVYISRKSAKALGLIK